MNEPLDGTVPVPADAQRVANVAWREARDEGCDCEPNIALSATPVEPFWRALVEHDDWCSLVRRLRGRGAPV